MILFETNFHIKEIPVRVDKMINIYFPVLTLNAFYKMLKFESGNILIQIYTGIKKHSQQ